MEMEDHPLSLDEILDETNQLDVGNRTKLWLQTDALQNNPKISVAIDGKFMYKPPYVVMKKKGLLKLLRQHDLKGLGKVFEIFAFIQSKMSHFRRHFLGRSSRVPAQMR